MKEGEVLRKHSLGAMLKFASRLLEKSFNDRMIFYNVTRSQMDLLGYVYERNREGKEVNQVDIEKHLNLKNPTVSGLIKRLEKKEYIKRELSSKGANFKSIFITNRGIELFKTNRKIAKEIEKEMFSILTKEEKEQLERILGKIIDNKFSGD